MRNFFVSQPDLKEKDLMWTPPRAFCQEKVTEQKAENESHNTFFIRNLGLGFSPLVSKNVPLFWLIWKRGYRTKFFGGQNLRRTKFFGGQNFRHQVEISAVLSDQIFSSVSYFPIFLSEKFCKYFINKNIEAKKIAKSSPIPMFKRKHSRDF